MNGQQLSAALRSGQRVYGTCILSISPHWLNTIKNLGLDLVFIDTEHVPNDRFTLSWICRAYRALDIAPVVRIPAPDPYQACMALDGGASGIIVPYVETVEEVRALRGAVKMLPLKGQRLARYLTNETPVEPEVQAYLDKRNQNVLILMIESVPAIERLDDLLSIPQVDAVLIGPHDLSINLGIPEQYTHPRFDEAVRTIISKARAHGVGAGIHFSGSIEQEIGWAQAGANLIMHNSDIGLFSRAMAADLKSFRAALASQDAGLQAQDKDAHV